MSMKIHQIHNRGEDIGNPDPLFSRKEKKLSVTLYYRVEEETGAKKLIKVTWFRAFDADEKAKGPQCFSSGDGLLLFSASTCKISAFVLASARERDEGRDEYMIILG